MTPQLTESEVAKIEERDWFLSAESLEKQVALTITERDALIRDWRALRADLKYRCEALEELRQCRDRWLAMLNPASPDETVDGAIRNLQQAYATERDNAAELQTENAALREQLRDATERFEAENETLAKVVKKRNELREQLKNEIFQDATNPTFATQPSARVAAEEIVGLERLDVHRVEDIIIKHCAASVQPVEEQIVEAFRQTAIKAHIGFKHKGPWDTCEWVECEDRRNLIQSCHAAANADNEGWTDEQFARLFPELSDEKRARILAESRADSVGEGK